MFANVVNTSLYQVAKENKQVVLKVQQNSRAKKNLIYEQKPKHLVNILKNCYEHRVNKISV